MKKKILAGIFAICASVSIVFAETSQIEKQSEKQTSTVSSDYGLCQSTYNSSYSYAYWMAINSGHSRMYASFAAHHYAHDQATRCMFGG